MQVILKKDVQNLGEAGDIVNVKDGYARNYLLPQSVAEIATEGALKTVKIISQESKLNKKNYIRKRSLLLKKLKNSLNWNFLLKLVNPANSSVLSQLKN